MRACARALVDTARWETAVFRVEISHGLLYILLQKKSWQKASTVTEVAINRQFDTNGFYHWFLVPFCFKTGCLLFLNSLNFFKLKRKVNLIYHLLCIERDCSAVYNYYS